MQEPAPRLFEPKPAFGTWLLIQRGREGWTGELASAAHADRAFPRNGDLEDVKKWLSTRMASGDDWAALEDAESDYLCY